MCKYCYFTFRFKYFKCATYNQSFIYSPTDALVSCLKNNIKIYIKIYMKTATAYFGVTVTPSSGSALIRAYYSKHRNMSELF